MIWLLPTPLPTLQSASCLSFSVSPVELTDGRWGEGDGGKGGGGAKSYDSEKASSYINHSILSDKLIKRFDINGF